VHVAWFGSDRTGDGSLTRPFRTPNKAEEVARAMMPSNRSPVTIVAHGSGITCVLLGNA
jgi:hypothetical protein